MNLANSLLKIWGLEPKDLRHPNARPVEKYDEIQPGDHVAVVRRDSTVWHHAIYCGNNEWIEFSGPDKEQATIAKIDTRYFFSKDDDIVVIDYPDGSYSSAETIALATKLLDSTTEYNALLSNCECVATFCRCGRYESEQVITILKHFIQTLRSREAAVISGSVGSKSGW